MLLQLLNQAGFSQYMKTKPKLITTTTTILQPPGLCLRLPEWAGTRKVKPIWIYWSKRQWVAVASAEHMQICISYQHSTTQFFTGQMPFLLPNQQHQSTEGKPVMTLENINVNAMTDEENVLWWHIRNLNKTLGSQTLLTTLQYFSASSSLSMQIIEADGHKFSAVQNLR